MRELQRRLGASAKRCPERRFHALYDQIARSDVLAVAWERVRRNKGAAGVDGVTLAAVEAYGAERMLAELQAALRQGTYHPSPVRRVVIPKPHGGVRPLGIPTVKDRVAQAAAKLVLEPIFEADFSSSSYGYRPRRRTTDALEAIRTAFPRGYVFAFDADIADFFGQIDHDRLLRMLGERISDRRMLKLVAKWLKAGVLDGSEFRETVAGTPQGGVISPLLANVYLSALDREWERSGNSLGVLVRYADDFVILCRTARSLADAERLVRHTLAGIGLELHPDKTRKVDLRQGREGFDFLGCHLRARVSGRLLERGVRRYYLHRWPSARSLNRIRQRVRDRTGRSRAHTDIREVIRELNPALRGWGSHFRTGNAADKFITIDQFVEDRLRRLLACRYELRGRNHLWNRWPSEWFKDQGLYRLRGTIRYPGGA
ncbi:MAG: group II intron reverse transcriptase/maturase [Candidatus Methylomirabilaceae bacterium]